jgi:predicted metal-dependent enzyme (double-stranded beta helix superfamily)
MTSSTNKLIHSTSTPERAVDHGLVSLAKELAMTARRWRGMNRPDRRTWDLMTASEQFEAWVIAWPPGGTIELHDHGGSAGAVVVVSGELMETTLSESAPRTVELVTTRLRAGSSVGVEPHRIHDMANQGVAPAISVHVYAPRLTAMTYYRVTDDRLEAHRTVRYHLDNPLHRGDALE